MGLDLLPTAFVASPSTMKTALTIMAMVKVVTAIIIIREWGDWKYSWAH